MIDEHKNPILIILIGLFVACGVLFGAFMLFSGKKESTAPAATNPATASAPTPTAPKNPAVATSTDLIEMVNKDSILKSTDGGETFETYFKVATTGAIGMADVLSVSFHPLVRNRVIVTTLQDGLFVNENKVNSWVPIAFPPKKIYSFILDKNSPDNRVFASGVVDDNGRMFRTDNAGGSWRAVYAEPGQGTYVSALAQFPKSPKIILAGTSGGTIVKSLDGGTSWKNVGSKIDGIISTFAFDSANTSFTYMLSYQNRIYHSHNGGSDWQNWEDEKAEELRKLYEASANAYNKGDQAGGARLREQADALAKRNNDDREPPGVINVIADPTKSGVVYAGTANGLYRSADFGKYWTKLNIIESAERFQIRSLAINPKNSNEIVFVAGKSFYKSTNRGDTWSITPLNNNRNASFVAYDPFDPKTVFVGMSSL